MEATIDSWEVYTRVQDPETQHMINPIGRKQSFGSKEFTLGSKSSSLKVNELTLTWHHFPTKPR